MKTGLISAIAALMLLAPAFAFATSLESASDNETASAAPDFYSKIINFLDGEPVRDGFMYLPFGMHTGSENKEISNNNLLGLFYNSFAVGTFNNSFDDRIWYLVYARNVATYQDFGLNYYAGAIYGYDGLLSTNSNIPLHDTFLYKYNLNPVITISPYYQISDQIELHAMFTFGYTIVGIKYNF